MVKEAKFYEKLSDGRVRCFLCRHRCIINDGGAGICGVRRNNSGVLYTMVYDYPVALNVDPIE
ncbi:MAG: radical SAM protein, partial [Candidatus Hydrothermia bacterium]|nr:radical SAM protein [Candidatus Hydrothermia bacterium]